MANPTNMTARVSMNYSDKAKKVFYNVHLGNPQKVQNIIDSLTEEGFIAEPIVNRSTGKVESGTFRVIFPLGEDPEGRVTWDEFKEDFFGEDGEGGEKGIINELFKVVEDYGYTIPQSDKQLVESTPQVVESTRKALKNANGNNVANMINNFFAHLHTPQVQKLLHSIKVVTKTTQGDPTQSVNDIGDIDAGSAKAILASQALSTRNTIWIISQWFNYNRQGIPTMIATANQWQEVGRRISVANYPLIASMPYRYSGDEMGEAGASALFGGVTQSDAYAMDPGVGRAFDRQASFQRVADGNYTKVVYFDISDTDVYDARKWQEFAGEANMENMSHEFNQKAIDLMSDKEKANLGQLQNQAQDDTQNQAQDDTQGDNQPIIKDNAVNAKLTIEAIIDMVGQNKVYADTMNTIKTRPDAITDILRSYYSHNDNIDREKNRDKKNAMLDICVGVTELELNIGLADVASKWNDVSRYFDTPNEVVKMSNNTAFLINKVREKQRDYVMGKFMNIESKSASMVTKVVNGQQVITKINGKYFMYWGEHKMYAATSDDLINWYPVLDEKGELAVVIKPRNGFFDSALTECGPPAVLTDKGIVLLYNGKNRKDDKRDKRFTAGAYCGGQILCDAKNPMKVLDRLDVPFFRPMAAFEKSGQYVDGTVFLEGLVYFRDKWFLYYGCADSQVGVAIYDPTVKTPGDNLK